MALWNAALFSANETPLPFTVSATMTVGRPEAACSLVHRLQHCGDVVAVDCQDLPAEGLALPLDVGIRQDLGDGPVAWMLLRSTMPVRWSSPKAAAAMAASHICPSESSPSPMITHTRLGRRSRRRRERHAHADRQPLAERAR